jgi:DNA-binding NarL/FixJ family response regulator
MEEYSGIQAVKAAAPSSAVVVISAFENRHFIERSIEAGASGFVPKSSPTPVMLSALKLIQLGEIYVPSSLMYGQAGLPDRGTATYFHPAGESAQARLDLLTKRQRDVLSLIGEGKSNRDISVALKISEGTVKVHVGAILKTLDVSNRTQAALLAIDLGLASPQLSRSTTLGTS